MRVAPASFRSLSGPTPGDATRANADRPWVMTEINAPRATSSADRTAGQRPPDNLTRTGASLPFRSLLHRPLASSLSAHGPPAQASVIIATQTSALGPPPGPQAGTRRHPEAGFDPEAKEAPTAALDPLLCQLAVNSGASSFVQANPATPVAPAALPLREDLQNLLTGLSRRAAWGGDRRKGSARIELSEGALAGATLVVHAEQRAVSVELELPSGVAASGWQQRIADRLEARGFSARVKVG